MKYFSVRGTRDILNEEALKLRYLEKLGREVFSSYGHREIVIPTFERTELFTRSIGEVSDIVEKEMYTFQDKKSRSLSLRPEGTAGVVRAYIERNLYRENASLRLYYLGPMFRYERPQAGRYREFRQIGAELFGSDNTRSDVEIINVFVDFFGKVGLKEKNFKLYINNVGCESCRKKYKGIFTESMQKNLSNLCVDCQRRFSKNPFRVLDCKNKQCRNYIENVPLISECLCQDCKKKTEEIKEYLQDLDIKYKEDPYLVRGLDYYTGIVFEIKCGKLGAQDAIAAGGRYDNLVKDMGGHSVPAVGCALGLERLLEVVNSEKIDLPIKKELDVYFACLGERALARGVDLAGGLRCNKVSCQVDYNEKSLKAQLKEANRLQAKFTVIIGDEELQKGVVILRDMEKEKQKEVKPGDLMGAIRGDDKSTSQGRVEQRELGNS
ncbi:histidine--tRNA ligase [bacterium]|nr:histidine--tRNA ligase [bacterium]